MSAKKKQDPFHGVGGAYVVDPKTGERKRAEEPVPAATTTTPERAAHRPTEDDGDKS